MLNERVLYPVLLYPKLSGVDCGGYPDYDCTPAQLSQGGSDGYYNCRLAIQNEWSSH